MCGICGTAGFADAELLRRMTSALHHRGPDDAGIFISPHRDVGLGNCRLSVIDLSSAGHMPMCNENEDVWITYNGEIYNFLELRAQLMKCGHRFRSNTDSEVLIHGYEEWGLSLLERLNGMFSFALADWRASADSGTPLLLLARDRFGIKPLYYTLHGRQLIFASEIKSILLAGVETGVQLEAMHRYLSLRWVPGPETMFSGIYKLAPGHYMLWQDGRERVVRYWDIQYSSDDNRSERELTQDLNDVFRRAVTRHLISDVPLGVFLSGGIDSSAILALATEITGGPVSAYTIAYRPEDGRLEQSDEDAKYARLVARTFGAKYHEILVTPDMIDVLPKVIWHMDEPVADAAAISTFLICEAARSELKVLLSGQGGDEVFAGYRVYLNHRLSQAVRRLPAGVRKAIFKTVQILPALKDRFPGIHPGLLLAAHRYFERLFLSADLSTEERFFFMQAYLRDDELAQLYSPEMREQLGNCRAGDRYFELFDMVPDQNVLNRMLYVDMKTFLPELNLTYSDKMSSAASVEVRVPFLDCELVDFASKLPPEAKLKGLTSKYILKKAFRGKLPDSVIRRRKAGFGAPIRTWLKRDLRDMVDELLSEEAIARRGYFNGAVVRRMIDADRAGTEDHGTRLWILLNLELWCRTFIDRRDAFNKLEWVHTSLPSCALGNRIKQAAVNQRAVVHS